MARRAYRLPSTVMPRRYDVHLHADVGEPRFRGAVGIDVEVREPVDRIELHARDMEIHRATVSAGGTTLEATVQPDEEVEMIALALPRTLPKGPARVHIDYTGTVQKNMEGLYLSTDGAESCLSTQCEETDARAIFPCWDEPSFKAAFATTVTTSRENTVLANGPLEKVEDDGAKRTWRFKPTKKMSSYLFATTIGRLAAGDEKVVAGVPMRVWAMEGKQHLGAFGNDFAAKLLPWYNDYFGQPYHFDKYDQVAVPSFSAGAMENSGLVIFRQEYLLHDKQTTSWRQERLIARVIAHEFAHMWFGNLVTMAWWDDIWLNEAFAEWMANKATDAIRPDYKVWDDFQSGRARALSSDALSTTHAIYTPVATAEEATELFDAITYEKGAAVMRMLESFLGEEPFRDGLRSYMREFAESNAQGADLWRHLAKSSGRPVGDIMATWVTQPGHPLVTVALRDGKLRLTQRRFFSSPNAEASSQTWRVPLVVRYEDARGVREQRILLEARDATIPLDAQGEVKWLHANAGAVGFYRQDLDDALMKRLLAHLDRLEPSELAGLLDDQWGLVRSGQQTIARFLDVLDAAMRRADSPTSLERVVALLHEVEEMLLDAKAPAAIDAYRAWVRDEMSPRLEALGYAPRAGEPKDTTELRRMLLVASASLGESPVAIAKAREMADREAEDPAGVDPDLAGTAVSIAARFGDAARVQRHVEVYARRRTAKAPPAQTQRYLQSLPAFRDRDAVARVIDHVERGTFPLEAIGPLLRAMLMTRHGRIPAWEHMMRQWGDIRSRLGDMWTGFLVEFSGNLPPERRAQMVEFYDRNLQGVAQQAYARALERLDQRAEFEARVRDDLVAWFRAR